MKRDIIFKIRLFETVVLILPEFTIAPVELEYLAKEIMNALAKGYWGTEIL